MATNTVQGDLRVTGRVIPQSLTPPDGCITTAAILADAVTVAKLSTYLKLGRIDLPLALAREIVTADIPNAAANGGLLASDTTPILQRINGATDPQLRLNWAATNVDAVTWSVMSPHDLDESQDVTVKIAALMAGATDTPTIDVDFREGIGGSDLGDVTGALSNSLATVSKAVIVTATAAAPKPWTITLTPGAHGTDALYLLAAWIEYTRK